MAPIKFEERIKKQLEQRTLQPSSNAWQKLTGRLDTEEKSNSKTPYWWIGIAASLTILITLSMFHFANKTSEKESILVETEIDAAQPDTLKQQKLKTTVATVKAPKIQDKTARTNNKNVTTQKKEHIKSLKETTTITNAHVIVESHTNNTPKIIKETSTLVNRLDSIEAVKIDEVVAEIQHLKSIKPTVTDSEIDSLLDLAQKELVHEKLLDTSSIPIAVETVNADALLEAVEDDIQKSFRTKVFEALKSNYKKVKTAVAERNN